MKWGAQVVHVAAKDIRHLKWPLIATLVFIGWVVAVFLTQGSAPGLTYFTGQNAYGVSTETRGIGGLVGLSSLLSLVGVVVAGLILSACVVQLDSTERVNAFWTTRPIAPMAVLVAKIAIVALAIALPVLAGGFVALKSLGAPWGDAMRTLSHSAAGYGQWLLAAMILAALTDSLAGFVLTFIGVGAGLLLISMRTTAAGPPAIASAPGVLFSVIGLVLSAAILVFLYSKHQADVLIRGAGWVAAACLLLGALLDPWPRRSSLGFGDAPELSSGPQLNMQLADTGTVWRRQAARITAPSASDSLRLQLKVDSIRIRGGSGTEWSSKGNQVAVINRGRPPIEGYAWKSDSVLPSTAVVSLRSATAGVTAPTVQRVDLSVTAFVSRPRIIAHVPLKPGTRLEFGGRRMEIYSAKLDVAGSNDAVPPPVIGTVVIRSLRLSGDLPQDQPFNYESGWPMSNLQFVLVDDQARQAIPLVNRGGGSGPGAMILPWFSAAQAFTVLGTREPLASPGDSAWYANASLIAVEWTPVGRYHTTLSATVP